MSIKTVTEKIINYKNVYLEGVQQIRNTWANETMTDIGKQQRVAELKERYTPMIEAAAERVINEIENTQAELIEERQKALTKGLESAEAVALVRKSIEQGDYSADMISDLIGAYADDPIMSEAIRAACTASTNEEIKLLASDIPEDKTHDQIKGLDKAIQRIKAAPKFSDQGRMSDYPDAIFWQNGAGIDSLVTFLLGLEDFEQTVPEQAEDTPAEISAEDLTKVFMNTNTGIKFGNDGIKRPAVK